MIGVSSVTSMDIYFKDFVILVIFTIKLLSVDSRKMAALILHSELSYVLVSKSKWLSIRCFYLKFKQTLNIACCKF